MLETTIVGSLPKPAWLAQPERLWAPWSVSGTLLESAKRDAVLLAIKEQEDIGIDIVTSGGMKIGEGRCRNMSSHTISRVGMQERVPFSDLPL